MVNATAAECITKWHPSNGAVQAARYERRSRAALSCTLLLAEVIRRFLGFESEGELQPGLPLMLVWWSPNGCAAHLPCMIEVKDGGDPI